MSVLKQKSLENAKAAETLIAKSLFSPSVHCSYYRCIQYVLHTLYEKYKVSDETLDKEPTVGSHNKMYNLLVGKFGDSNRIKALDFQKHTAALKRLRNQADYKDVEIGENDAKNALSKSGIVVELINKVCWT